MENPWNKRHEFARHFFVVNSSLKYLAQYGLKDGYYVYFLHYLHSVRPYNYEIILHHFNTLFWYYTQKKGNNLSDVMLL